MAGFPSNLTSTDLDERDIAESWGSNVSLLFDAKRCTLDDRTASSLTLLDSQLG
jgi:hypothetical protein